MSQILIEQWETYAFGLALPLLPPPSPVSKRGIPLASGKTCRRIPKLDISDIPTSKELVEWKQFYENSFFNKETPILTKKDAFKIYHLYDHIDYRHATDRTIHSLETNFRPRHLNFLTQKCIQLPPIRDTGKKCARFPDVKSTKIQPMRKKSTEVVDERRLPPTSLLRKPRLNGMVVPPLSLSSRRAKKWCGWVYINLYNDQIGSSDNLYTDKFPILMNKVRPQHIITAPTVPEETVSLSETSEISWHPITHTPDFDLEFFDFSLSSCSSFTISSQSSSHLTTISHLITSSDTQASECSLPTFDSDTDTGSSLQNWGKDSDRSTPLTVSSVPETPNCPPLSPLPLRSSQSDPVYNLRPLK